MSTGSMAVRKSVDSRSRSCLIAPESTKRSLIANSVQIHKTKGTVSAIERVMDALGVTAELREWFEYNGQPHTFHLTAWANSNLVPDAEAILSPVLYRTLQRSVDNVKPVRGHA
jgi:phage tail P2-like protein